MADKTLGEQIAEARDAKGLTQKALSARLGRGGSVRAIQAWEADENVPHKHMLARLRQELGMPAGEGEEQESWPTRVQRVTHNLGDALATLPPADVKKLRSEFIRLWTSEGSRRAGVEWSADVEVVTDLIGGYLTAEPN